MSRFLAEDFRNLLDKIECIAEDNSQPPDLSDLLVTSRPENIQKDSIESVDDLINYLDQFPELSDYRNQNAKFDDAFYDLPLDELLNVTEITEDDLNKINDKSKPNTGTISINDNIVSIFGSSEATV